MYRIFFLLYCVVLYCITTFIFMPTDIYETGQLTELILFTNQMTELPMAVRLHE